MSEVEVGDRVCLLDLDRRWGLVNDIDGDALVVYIEPDMLVRVPKGRVEHADTPSSARVVITRMLQALPYHRLTTAYGREAIERQTLEAVQAKLVKYGL